MSAGEREAHTAVLPLALPLFFSAIVLVSVSSVVEGDMADDAVFVADEVIAFEWVEEADVDDRVEWVEGIFTHQETVSVPLSLLPPLSNTFPKIK